MANVSAVILISFLLIRMLPSPQERNNCRQCGFSSIMQDHADRTSPSPPVYPADKARGGQDHPASPVAARSLHSGSGRPPHPPRSAASLPGVVAIARAATSALFERGDS